MPFFYQLCDNYSATLDILFFTIDTGIDPTSILTFFKAKNEEFSNQIFFNPFLYIIYINNIIFV